MWRFQCVHLDTGSLHYIFMLLISYHRKSRIIFPSKEKKREMKGLLGITLLRQKIWFVGSGPHNLLHSHALCFQHNVKTIHGGSLRYPSSLTTHWRTERDLLLEEKPKSTHLNH